MIKSPPAFQPMGSPQSLNNLLTFEAILSYKFRMLN